MDSTSQALKPCPFCGGEPELTQNFRGEDYGFRMTHRCPVIGALSFDWASKESHLARWNTRTMEPKQ